MNRNQNQLLIRSFSPDQDIPRLLLLYAAVEAVDHTENEVSEQALRDQLNAPNHDPRKDRWVVAATDNPTVLIGSALLKVAPGSTRSEANVQVHPEWRHHGIGSALLSKVVKRAHQLESPAIEIYASARPPDATGFLQNRGFTVQGAYTELRLAEGIKLPPIIWPYGYTMRHYSETQDITILTQAMNLCYIPLWGHREVSEDEIASWLPAFEKQGLFQVFSEKGRVVGISRAEPSPERSLRNGIPTGYIDAPGVVPQHRRLDLYRALVLTGIAWLHQKNQAVIEMESWGDKLEVLKMYRELGFQDIRQLLCYQMDLSHVDQTDQPVSL